MTEKGATKMTSMRKDTMKPLMREFTPALMVKMV